MIEKLLWVVLLVLAAVVLTHLSVLAVVHMHYGTVKTPSKPPPGFAARPTVGRALATIPEEIIISEEENACKEDE